ncbi:hypothetical protein [Marseilla massiliensis]|mgnify:FL=1|jgi:hypothetical protein|uniref:DUF3887 domain-containing protein n=1 Tax=Marseilla massiliensis TaxID=1841864 RepID=A0A939B5A6_9BACT|nr:hypothetical protein [Marseilla massiliensis]MBM6662244.1 hypothetical protein [Marseilla massiliensis]MCL1609659.1 hypothetical protein [Marseilla massiliensis]
MKIRHILLSSAMLLLASCGQQHKAESVVEDFMENNLKDASALQIVEYSDIDSTRYLNDSIINKLRNTAKNSSMYAGRTEFAQRNKDEKLIIIRVRYKINGQDFHDTFYLNKEMTGVIALKNN